MVKYDPSVPIQLYLHHGEPYFVLRAQDVLSLGVLAYYQLVAQASGAENAQAMAAVLVEFSDWQTAHGDLVKLPD